MEVKKKNSDVQIKKEKVGVDFTFEVFPSLH